MAKTRREISKAYYDRNKGTAAARHATWMRSISGRYYSGKDQAKQRGHEWSLSSDEYTELVALPCHYCGGRLNETGSGLDRIDNAQGYTKENVVPCCYACNKLKGERLNYFEAKAVISLLVKIRKGAPIVLLDWGGGPNQIRDLTGTGVTCTTAP